ncbi:MAG: hypothetical protein ABI589_10805 [Burkholderiales bacterium]
MKNSSTIAIILTALTLCAGPAFAANSAEATAAAKRHLAEKRGTGAAPAAPAAAPASASTPAHMANAGAAWSAQLASCKAQAGMNLVKREKCVWSHCNGHWGQGDCPPGSDWPPKFEKPKFERFGTTPASPR